MTEFRVILTPLTGIIEERLNDYCKLFEEVDVVSNTVTRAGSYAVIVKLNGAKRLTDELLDKGE